MEKNKIIIVCEGGLVRSVFSHDENVEVEILNHDLQESSDENEVAEYELQNGRVNEEKKSMVEIY